MSRMSGKAHGCLTFSGGSKLSRCQRKSGRWLRDAELRPRRGGSSIDAPLLRAGQHLLQPRPRRLLLCDPLAPLVGVRGPKEVGPAVVRDSLALLRLWQVHAHGSDDERVETSNVQPPQKTNFGIKCMHITNYEFYGLFFGMGPSPPSTE